jgi:hypothetical protein
VSVYLQEAKLWRFIVTSLSSETITFLDPIASGRQLHYAFAEPSTCALSVPADDSKINLIHSDGLPYLAEGTRLLYGFRREDTTPGTGPTDDVWTCRFGGRIEQLEDSGESDDGTTQITAYDPWRYLGSRWTRGEQPDPAGGPPKPGRAGAEGLTYKASVGWSPVEIIEDQFNRIADVTVFSPSLLFEYGLDIGDFDANDPLGSDFVVEQGWTMADLFQAFMERGLCDIVITPKYDPALVPGIVGELNIVPKYGSYVPEQVFGWDLAPRNLVGVSKLVDGTERINKVQYFGGKAGAPVTTTPVKDTNSIARYGIYEEYQWFPDAVWPWQYVMAANAAAFELAFRLNGQITYQIRPVAERSPRPFQDYFLGDWFPVYWDDHLREATKLVQRVTGFDIDINDDSLESVSSLTVIVSEDDQPAGFAGGPPYVAAPMINLTPWFKSARFHYPTGTYSAAANYRGGKGIYIKPAPGT